jgi:hypothetical protein
MSPSPRKAASATDFDQVFADLRAILAPYERKLSVVRDEPGYYYLDTHTIGPNKKPIMFAAIRVMKNYVSYHFMPIYWGASIMGGVSPALKKRMQGKACFNFAEPDKALFRELKALTKAGYSEWKKIEWVD